MWRPYLLSATMLLCASSACKRSTPASAETSAEPDAGNGTTQARSDAAGGAAGAAPSSSIGPATPVAGQYGRYYVDDRRFSAAYPVSPDSKRLSPTLAAVESLLGDGSGYAVICGPDADAGSDVARMRDQAVKGGTLLSESHPKVFGTEAYEVHSRLRAGELRVMRFIHYAGRFCSVGFEIVNGADEAKGMRFIESFRPESPPP